MSEIQFEFFDRMTPKYNDDRLAFVVDEIPLQSTSSQSLIDVGCGDGSILEYLKTEGFLGQVKGIDPASSYVELARERGLDAAVGSVLDDESLASDSGAHDYVVMASVLHHLVHETSWRQCRENAREGVANCLSLMKPGGRLFVFEPLTEPSLVNRIAFHIKSVVIRMGGNRRIDLAWMNFGAPLVAFFTLDELTDLVESAGGTVDSVVEVGRSRFWPATRVRVGLVISASA